MITAITIVTIKTINMIITMSLILTIISMITNIMIIIAMIDGHFYNRHAHLPGAQVLVGLVSAADNAHCPTATLPLQLGICRAI